MFIALSLSYSLCVSRFRSPSFRCFVSSRTLSVPLSRGLTSEEAASDRSDSAEPFKDKANIDLINEHDWHERGNFLMVSSWWNSLESSEKHSIDVLERYDVLNKNVRSKGTRYYPLLFIVLPCNELSTRSKSTETRLTILLSAPISIKAVPFDYWTRPNCCFGGGKN